MSGRRFEWRVVSFMCVLSLGSWERLNFMQMSSDATAVTANCGPIWIPKAENQMLWYSNNMLLLFKQVHPRPTHFRPGCPLGHSISFHSSCSSNKQPEESFEWKLLNQSAASTPYDACPHAPSSPASDPMKWMTMARNLFKQAMNETDTEIANMKRKHNKTKHISLFSYSFTKKHK